MTFLRTLPMAAVLLTAVAVAPAHAGPTSGSLSKGGYYKMQSVDPVTFDLGLFTVSCGDVTVVSTLAAVNATKITADGGAGGSHVSFDKCAAIGFPFTVTTSGTWTVTAYERTQTGPPELWSVTFGIGGAVLQVTGQDCTVTLDLPQTLPAVFNDENPPTVPNTTITITTTAFFSVKGTWFLCPTDVTTADLHATFAVSANTQQDFKGSGVEVNLF